MTPNPATRPGPTAAAPAGEAGTGAGRVLEQRRLRTWDEASEPPAQPWRILVRYGVVRMTRTWWIATLLVLIGVGQVIILAGSTYFFASGEGLSYEAALVGAVVMLYPSMALLLVAGAPLFAEDLRVNAPVFYFSRPLERSQYIKGKLAFLGGILGATTLVPMAIACVLLLLMGTPLAQPPEYYDTLDVQAWRIETIDTTADALYTIATLLPATALVLWFLASATALASAWTRRAWHAGLTVIAGLGAWSMLGAMATQFTPSALRNLFGPAGWFELTLATTQEVRYAEPLRQLQEARYGSYRYSSYYDQRLDHAGISIAIAYVALAAFSLLFTYLTARRVRSQEVSQ